MRNWKHATTLLLLVFLNGCKIYDGIEFDTPPICVPNEFYHSPEGGVQVHDEWWEEFGIPELNTVVERTLANNFDLKQAWDRLAQARAFTRVVGADRYPQVDLDANISYVETSGENIPSTQTKTVLLGGNLFYEVDLWRKIHSRYSSAWEESRASYEEVQTTALVLAGTATDLWFTIQEQRELLALLDKQIESNATRVELLELRFSVGESSALDVYQQRLQLAATESDVPPIQARLETAINQLQILMGSPPEAFPLADAEKTLVELPPLPDTQTPMDLLIRRPDLRAQHHRIAAADYAVAAAIADRFPKLTFLLSYDFTALEWRDIFDREMLSIIADLVTPIIDGGRRIAEVDRRKAIVCEELHRFGQFFLDALGEVEDAIAEERNQVELLARLEKQMEWTKLNLRESRSHYLNGLNDYLTVITAVQALQNLERQMIAERKRLLVIRSRLYLALGGFHIAKHNTCGEK